MTIGTSESSASDKDYVKEHSPLKYLRKKMAHYLQDFHHHWFASFGFPPSNGSHKQLYVSDIRRLMRRVQHRTGHQGGGSGKDRAKIQVFSRLDIGHKESATRTGAQGVAASFTRSTRGPCAGPLTIRRGPWQAEPGSRQVWFGSAFYKEKLNIMQTNGTPILPNANQRQTEGKVWM